MSEKHWKEKLEKIINKHDISVNDILDHWHSIGLINNPERTKKKQGGIGWEELSRFELNKYDSDLKKPNLDIDDRSHLFYNKKVVITGAFENFGRRETMAKMIKRVGGDNNTTISKKTDFVIVGENGGPSKMKKITELGTKTLNENEFIELFK